MKYAIIGSRSFNDYDKLKSILDECDNITEIISGGAKGADSLAALYAENHDIKLTIFKPNWAIGRHAGLLRNTLIVQESDVILAFWDGKSKGTLNSINTAEKLGKQCLKIII